LQEVNGDIIRSSLLIISTITIILSLKLQTNDVDVLLRLQNWSYKDLDLVAAGFSLRFLIGSTPTQAKACGYHLRVTVVFCHLFLDLFNWVVSSVGRDGVFAKRSFAPSSARHEVGPEHLASRTI